MSMRNPQRSTTRSLPVGATVASGVLLALPLVALALVGTYARKGPELWGFPFFYWYQFLWVFLASACTYGAYLIIERGRGDGRSRGVR